MPRPGQNIEKPKNFFQSIKRLFHNLREYRIILTIILVLSFLSAVFSIVAPNLLSKITDEITDGIKPNTEVLQELGTKIYTNLSSVDQTKILEILSSDKISIEDKIAFDAFIKRNNYETELFSLPESILSLLIDDINYKGNVITYKEQMKFIELMSTMGDSLENLDKLPESIYTLVEPKINISKIKHFAIILAILYILSSIFNYIQGFGMATVSNIFAKKLRTNISHKINKLPLKYFDTFETGDILSRITNDVDLISQNLNQSLATLVSSATLFLGALFMMFYTNALMAITAVGASVIGFVFMFIILSKSQKYFIRKQKELGDLNGYIEEMYSGHTVVRAYNGEEDAKEEFSKLNKKLYKSNLMSQFLSGLMPPFMGFIGNFGYVCVCVVGALLVMNNQITFGVIVAFMIYVRLFTNPLSQIAQAMTSMQSTAAAAERVFEFVDEKEMTLEDSLTKTLDKKEVKGEIVFDHVRFGYDSNRDIIHDFSASVKPGQKIAIVGPTGAGKTTMVNLLMKFYEINSGDITIDGVSIHDLTRENIHDLFCMVLQDTWLFNGTIRDNIKFNEERITDEEIMSACKTVGVSHFIKTLSGGLDAEIGDSDSISGGQKQLFTIARGMLKNSPFLILDEATSNVDTRTEELVQKAMDKLTVGKTSFIIAHRLSTIKNADLILVMDNGDIVEKGTHEELLKKNGFYAKLYNSQFEKTEI